MEAFRTTITDFVIATIREHCMNANSLPKNNHLIIRKALV